MELSKLPYTEKGSEYFVETTILLLLVLKERKYRCRFLVHAKYSRSAGDREKEGSLGVELPTAALDRCSCHGQTFATCRAMDGQVRTAETELSNS